MSIDLGAVDNIAMALSSGTLVLVDCAVRLPCWHRFASSASFEKWRKRGGTTNDHAFDPRPSHSIVLRWLSSADQATGSEERPSQSQLRRTDASRTRPSQRTMVRVMEVWAKLAKPEPGRSRSRHARMARPASSAAGSPSNHSLNHRGWRGRPHATSSSKDRATMARQASLQERQ